MYVRPFDPAYGTCVSIAVGTTAGAAIMPSAGNDKNNAIVVTCVGTQPIFVKITADSSTALATTADYMVLPNSQVTLTKAAEWNRITAIAGAAGSTLYAIEGTGL